MKNTKQTQFLAHEEEARHCPIQRKFDQKIRKSIFIVAVQMIKFELHSLAFASLFHMVHNHNKFHIKMKSIEM